MENLQKFEEFDFKAAWKAGRKKKEPHQPINDPDISYREPGTDYADVEPEVYEDQALFDKIDAKIRGNFKIENLSSVYNDGSEYDYKLGLYKLIIRGYEFAIQFTSDNNFQWLDCDANKRKELLEFIINRKHDAENERKRNIKSKFSASLDERKRYRR